MFRASSFAGAASVTVFARVIACVAACSFVVAAARGAAAQTSPVQGTNPAAVAEGYWSPTSLQPDTGVTLPRTADGRPDFQGVVWDANSAAFLQAPGPLTIAEDKQKAAFDRVLAPFLSNPEYKIHPDGFDYIFAMDGLPLVRGERRTRLLVQPATGGLPLTPEARKELATPMAGMMAPKADNPEERMTSERCIVAADLPPSANLFIPGTRSFVQTREHILVHFELGDEARIFPFAAAPAKRAAPSSYGDTSARWDGDTLVLTTTNLPVSQRRRLLPVYIVNPDAKVIERFTRVSESELVYQFTIEDPKVFSAPWLGEYSFHRASYPMFPNGCHEGNYSLPNILAGQRVADAKAAAKPKP